MNYALKMFSCENAKKALYGPKFSIFSWNFYFAHFFFIFSSGLKFWIPILNFFSIVRNCCIFEVKNPCIDYKVVCVNIWILLKPWLSVISKYIEIYSPVTLICAALAEAEKLDLKLNIP